MQQIIEELLQYHAGWRPEPATAPVVMEPMAVAEPELITSLKRAKRS